ncbi:hypothetical protein E2C01_073179 [Portunus trituberculatus]|uniref:Uncharacterized protein n=1 Tax=Portunus trituberculatus TaxID=210409 RepID=A0A5B7IDB4_PORTR|nr:hypothetical protein [Portunus trituberculatus]
MACVTVTKNVILPNTPWIPDTQRMVAVLCPTVECVARLLCGIGLIVNNGEIYIHPYCDFLSN